MKIQDRTFIVTGGASGLGLATAKELHKNGGYISIMDMNSEAGETLVKELGTEKAKFFEVDVTKTESIQTAVNETAQWTKSTGIELGGVITAAGVGFPGKIIDRHNEPLAMESIDFVLNINLRGTLDTIRLALPHMTQVTPTHPDGERGIIVMVASSAAFDGQPGQVAYAASKGAVASMTLPLTRDIAQYGIRAVTIAPSLFESNMTKLLSNKVRKSLERVMEFPVRAGKAEEFAALVRHCIENSMLNGTVLRLDGGMRMPSKL
ncbi:NAD(P)-binding protein [Patellaria atrata CBS 101060]|uniref:NAD(P)-binding protein n=1 Tax=Patellaria atrata CBS 101060 TaxID=1346257 RepID=A0A9P4SCL9_9PEZI|nr:NAD(P)-binding protein [Patellaria atrata CBS 101060]